MTEVVAAQDIIITTAAVPGAKSPILVTEDMVKAMKPGAVIVDLAAERGGNCDLTEQGKTVVVDDVTIIGPENVPKIGYHASQMYGKNADPAELILDGRAISTLTSMMKLSLALWSLIRVIFLIPTCANCWVCQKFPNSRAGNCCGAINRSTKWIF